MSTLFLSDCMPQDLPGLPVHMYMGSKTGGCKKLPPTHVASFQGLSHFWSLVCVQDKYTEVEEWRKSGKAWEHLSHEGCQVDARGGCREGRVHV